MLLAAPFAGFSLPAKWRGCRDSAMKTADAPIARRNRVSLPVYEKRLSGDVRRCQRYA